MEIIKETCNFVSPYWATIFYFLWILFLFGIVYVFLRYQDKFNSLLPNIGSRNHDYFIWILINGVLCQLPLIFMFLNSVDPRAIFASGLSYIFTLYISSLYMLLSMSDRDGRFRFVREKLHITSIIAIASILGLLSIYPGISQKNIKFLLVDKPLWSYPLIMMISLFFAFSICKPAIDERYDEAEKERKSTAPIVEAAQTEEQFTDLIGTMNRGQNT
jgi:hypothetical protein